MEENDKKFAAMQSPTWVVCNSIGGIVAYCVSEEMAEAIAMALNFASDSVDLEKIK
jgi:hypothetical protein